LSVRDAYFAIADPTRRDILELVRDHQILTAGEIAANFETVSRPSISRHLRLLRESGLLKAHRQGKTQNYELDPKPIAAIREGWLAGFAERQSASLAALRRRVESD
jgi:DNA-binding transcriptional ArsR family regulator